MIARLGLAAVFVLWASAGLAAPMPNSPPCADMAVIHQRLADQGMELVARGVFNNGDLVEVMANTYGDFTVVFAYAAATTIRGQGGVFTLPPGTACIVDGGTGWKSLRRCSAKPREIGRCVVSNHRLPTSCWLPLSRCTTGAARRTEISVMAANTNTGLSVRIL